MQGWIDRLDLEPHPEGGWYREVYRSDDVIAADALPDRFDGPRHAAALIYFLLPSGAVSALHRIQQDELWHFLDGDGLTIHAISPDGTYRTHRLGRDVDDGRLLQAVVPATSWFGATVDSPAHDADAAGFALVGCTTAPAFDFADFELAARDVLVDRFPAHRDVIVRLTPDAPSDEKNPVAAQ